MISNNNYNHLFTTISYNTGLKQDPNRPQTGPKQAPNRPQTGSKQARKQTVVKFFISFTLFIFVYEEMYYIKQYSITSISL